MTHSDIVNIAYKWLLKNGRIGFAFKELKSLSQEIPDVIGFDSWQSTLIECKISRSDFLSDQKKTHRKKGMGNWRFYCCPKGLIKQKDLPPKWGLIYVDEKGRAQIEYDCRRKRFTRNVRVVGTGKEIQKGFITGLKRLRKIGLRPTCKRSVKYFTQH
jgi:hypothetical protein